MSSTTGPAPLQPTPLLRLGHVSRVLGAEVYLKAETCNPFGEARLRAIEACLRGALEKGLVRASGFVIDAADASLALPMAIAANRLDLRLMLCVPAGAAATDLEALEELGCKTLLTPADGGIPAAIERAAKERWDSWRSWSLDPYGGGDLARAWHDLAGEETARELALAGIAADAFVAGVGTGACFTGVARRLKEANPDLLACAVEPAESPVLSGGKPAPHRIRGIGCGFVPRALDRSLVGDVIAIGAGDAEAAARRAFAMESLPLGIATGATLRAIMELARRPGWRGKTIVGIITDDRRTLAR